MRPWLSSLFACLALLPCVAFSQETTPDYQPTAQREVRTAGPVLDRPGSHMLTTSYRDDALRTDAAEFIRHGCDSGSTTACANLSTLGNDLSEAQGPIRAKYEELAEKCRIEKATSESSNPCGRAFSYYAGRISSNDLSEPLALLHENCRDDGKVTGCKPLNRFYSGQEFLLADRSRRSWPEQPEKAMAAMKIGCIPTLEAVGNCGSLGVYYERQGDFAAAAEAYAIGCDIGMSAGKGEYYGQGRVCNWAAKNARDKIQDYANARKWFSYVCHVDENPFACKFLGLMYAQAEGGEADPLTALGLYRLGCDMTDDITLGDGTSCFLYGQLLVEMRGKVIRDSSELGYAIVPTDYTPKHELIRTNLTEVSRAYLRGCMDNRDVACKAHAALLDDWSSGAYPRGEVECRIMDAEERMAPAKICQRFSFYLTPPHGMGDRGWVNVFVWPDGDRTVSFDDYENPVLNGNAGIWIEPEGGWECIRSSASGRSFCNGPY